MTRVLDGRTAALEEWPAPDPVSGEPRASGRVVGVVAGAEIGLWEHSVGTSRDTEVEEVFVVLDGEATVRFVDSGESVELGPGSICRLAAGERTEWEVRTPLRKVYVAAAT